MVDMKYLGYALLGSLLITGCSQTGGGDSTPSPSSTSANVTPTQDKSTPNEGGMSTPTPETPTAPPNDNDGDGYGASEDCNDSDALTHPDANEICDGSDNDCDGSTDEGSLWYSDYDQDGYGEHDEFFWWDFCDLFFNEGDVADSSDCNDYDEEINPGAQEICDESNTDEDCDGKANDADTSMSSEGLSDFFKDSDGDGYGGEQEESYCQAPEGYYATNSDCNDEDSSINPGADEICDGLDNNCDGQSDEGATWYADSDSDGYGDSENTLEQCEKPEGYTDNAQDCNDNNDAINPDANDTTCDGVDDNCDGENDNAYVALSCGIGQCEDSAQLSYCENGVESACVEGTPSTDEDISCDGEDEDCDGIADEDYAPIAQCGVGYCTTSITPSSCSDGSELQCQPGPALSDDDATCDEIDDDCDGVVDEDCTDNCSDLPSLATAQPLCEGGCPTAFTVLKELPVNFDTTGITLDGTRLLLSDFEGGGIFAMDNNSGESTYLFPSPGDSPTGLHVNGDSLYSVDIADNQISRLDLANGEVLATATTPGAAIRDLDIYWGSLWGMSREDGRIYRIDEQNFESQGSWPSGLSEAAGVGFCAGFPLVSSRTEGGLYIYDLDNSQTTDFADIPGMQSPYAIACSGTSIWVSDSAADSVVQVGGPIFTGQLNSSDQQAGLDTLPVDRDACAPFDLYEFGHQGDEGLMEIVIAAQEHALVVAVFDQNDNVLFSKEVPAQRIARLPSIAMNGVDSYFLEVGAKDAETNTDYGVWARYEQASMKEISGTVFGDDVSIAAAKIYVDSDNFIAQSNSDENGLYDLNIPVDASPDYVLITAEHPDFASGIQQVDTRSGPQQLNFYLSSDLQGSLVVPGTEVVTHLGDDSFSGTLNSQFVKNSEGVEKSHTFVASQEQADKSLTVLRITLKGAQKNNELLLNDVLVDYLDTSPDDGSYGVYSIEVDPWSVLVGDNVLIVRSVQDDSDDYDDFEYAYITLEFSD